MWLGYRDDDVIAWRGGRARRYGAADGLDVGSAGALYDDDGLLLVAGERALALFDGRRFRSLRAADPQVLQGITGIARTPDGTLWLNGRRGLVRVAAAAWEAERRGRGGTVLPCELFDTLDGYPGIAQGRSAQPSLVVDRAGVPWLNGTNGAARLDARRLYRNTVVPPVRVSVLEAGGRTYGVGAPVALPAGTDDLQIGYAAASFTMPERVRFRYRLEGVDDGWRDAGGRRTAYYTRLGPGHYRFRVSAANEDGVWNATGAALDFTIAPTFAQSLPFKVLCGAALALGAWGLHRIRLRHATARLRRLLHERANERERIARALHDTLMQSVQALLMLFTQARDRLPPDDVAGPLLDRTLDLARASLVEGRDALPTLRGAARVADDLPAVLARLGMLLSEQYGAAFEVEVRGSVRSLRGEIAAEAGVIAREALQNAFRHARAARVVLTVDFGERAFLLSVRDDGRGLPAQADEGGRWGLVGMRERAAAIDAALALRSAPGQGTTVELGMAAHKAYAAAAGGWRAALACRRRARPTRRTA